MDDDLIVCKECGDQTSEPPEERPDWKGMCPQCVVKKWVLPLIEDDMLRELTEHMINSQPIMALAVPASLLKGGDVDFGDAFKKAIMTDPQVREKLKDILEMLDKEVPIKKVTVQKPIVHNDPRTS